MLQPRRSSDELKAPETPNFPKPPMICRMYRVVPSLQLQALKVAMRHGSIVTDFIHPYLMVGLVSALPTLLTWRSSSLGPLPETNWTRAVM